MTLILTTFPTEEERHLQKKISYKRRLVIPPPPPQKKNRLPKSDYQITLYRILEYHSPRSLKTLNSSVFVTKFNIMYVLLHFEVFEERGGMIFDINNLVVPNSLATFRR